MEPISPGNPVGVRRGSRVYFLNFAGGIPGVFQAFPGDVGPGADAQIKDG